MNEAEARASSKTGPRLFVDMRLEQGLALPLPHQSGHYLTRVMRLGEGDGVRVFDDRTGEWQAEIEVAGKRETIVRITRQLAPRETVPDLWLCMAPIRKGRIEWVAEKACELGVARIAPTLTRRTVTTAKPEKLRAHMIEAAEQCERTALPELGEPVPLLRLLAEWPPERKLIYCDEAGGQPATAMAQIPPPAAVLIGPEGGFDEAERAAIRALPQAVPISLGPRILRADTAAAVAVGIWQALSGDWSAN